MLLDKELYDANSFACSKLTTNNYSTSFSAGIHLLDKSIHDAIYSIYGFVRFADEIVDTFHDSDKATMLAEFKTETYKSINHQISSNPILHCFQITINKYNIDLELIETFLNSMEMDLSPQKYDEEKFKLYILGSAEVVGLMCLKVFVDGDQTDYDTLKPYAMSLGSAFQKINFLRDLNNDLFELGRVYFPWFNNAKDFNCEIKKTIEIDLDKDFKHALIGIQKLPKNSQLGVYTAYKFYQKLLEQIKTMTAKDLFNKRPRINNFKKLRLILNSIIQCKLSKELK